MKNIVIPFLVFVLINLISCTRTQIDSPQFEALMTSTNTALVQKNNIGTATRQAGTSVDLETPAPTLDGITMTPAMLTIDPTYLIFPTQTSTPTIDPDLFLIHIIAPGPMSKVVSPVDFIIHIAPEYTGSTRIELVGEDGTSLFVKVFKTYSNLGYFTRIEQKIDFEIRGAAEIARLQVSTYDSVGLMQAFNSVRILLQAVGDNQFTHVDEVRDRVLLRSPSVGDSVKGGFLNVQGDYRPVDSLPVIFDLIGLDGTLLGSRIIQLSPSDGNYQQFNTTIPYEIQKRSQAKLVIRQSDDRIDGLAYLFSRSITLDP